MTQSIACHSVDSWTLLPSLRGWMGSERIQGASEQICKFELLPWTPVPVRCVCCIRPICILWNRAREQCLGISILKCQSPCRRLQSYRMSGFQHYICMKHRNEKLGDRVMYGPWLVLKFKSGPGELSFLCSILFT